MSGRTRANRWFPDSPFGQFDTSPELGIFDGKMKVVVEIADHEAAFGMKVLKSLSFVKKTKAMSSSAEHLWKDLQEAAEQVRLHKLGKIKLKTAEEFLREL